MQLFFSKNIKNGIAQLDEVEARHAVQVLRRKVGDAMQLTDGEGNLYDGTVLEIGKKSCLIGINSTIEAYNERPFKLHIAIAPTKNIDRFEWFLEKATELGIEEITPLLCRYSERKHLNHERCEKILVSAMKQSNRLYLPKLNELTKFDTFLKNNFDGTKVIAHCEPSEKKSLHSIIVISQQLLMLVGPEGDFSKEEIEAAIANNFEAAALGKKRLRTETAAIHICSAVSFITNK